MRIILFGNGNSIFIKSYIEYVLLKLGAEITMVTPKVINSYQHFYKEKGIVIINNHIPSGLIYKIPIVRTVIAQYLLNKKIKKAGPYDFFHVHYVEKWACLQAVLDKNNHGKILLSFWGSDIFNSSKFDNAVIRICLKLAHNITITTHAMLEQFQNLYGYQFKDKLVCTKFGTPVYDSIFKVEDTEDIMDSKRKLNLPDNKIVIVCGYNGRSQQQHLLILRTLAEIPIEIKEKIYLVIPMAYGVSDDRYVQEVDEALSCSGYNGLIMNNFMNEDDTARFRLCGDIFINLQTTDAFSASMQEHLFASSVVINGSWLKYWELDDKRVFYYNIDKFVELAVLIPEIINDLEEVKKKVKINRRLMGDSLSWQSVADQWVKLYK